MRAKGDMLFVLLSERMASFVRRRISVEAKRKHWALRLAHKNLTVVAAYMVLADHVKSDLTFVDGDGTMSLLSPDSKKYFLCKTFPMHSGAYLYYDMNNGEFVRSGKVGDRGFLARHEEHLKESKKVSHNSSTSTFYLRQMQKVDCFF